MEIRIIKDDASTVHCDECNREGKVFIAIGPESTWDCSQTYICKECAEKIVELFSALEKENDHECCSCGSKEITWHYFSSKENKYLWFCDKCSIQS